MDLLSLFEVGPLKSGGRGEPAGQRQAMMIDAAEGCRRKDQLLLFRKTELFSGVLPSPPESGRGGDDTTAKTHSFFFLVCGRDNQSLVKEEEGGAKRGGSAFHFQPPLVGSKKILGKKKTAFGVHK